MLKSPATLIAIVYRMYASLIDSRWTSGGEEDSSSKGSEEAPTFFVPLKRRRPQDLYAIVDRDGSQGREAGGADMEASFFCFRRNHHRTLLSPVGLDTRFAGAPLLLACCAPLR
jgi:hypothetical protein